MKIIWVIFVLVMLVRGAGAESLSLNGAFEKALMNDGRLLGTKSLLEASKEGSRQARSRLFPTLNLLGRTGLRQYAPRYADDIRDETTSSFSANLVQPIYHPEYMAELEKAELASGVTELKYTKEKSRLAKEVAEAYFEVGRTQQNMDLRQASLEAHEVKYAQIERTHSFGLSSKVDLLQAKVNLDEARVELIREKQHLDMSRIHLSRLTGEDVKILPSLKVDPWSIESLFNFDRAQWKGRLGNNVDLRLADQSLKVAREDSKTRKYGHYPKIDMELSYTHNDSTDININRRDSRADVELKIPIFQGWYVDSRVREGRHLVEAANQEAVYSRRVADLQFEEVWERYVAAFENVKVLRDAVKSADLYVVSIEKSYAKGLKSLFDLYDAKAKRLKVQKALADNMFDIAVTYVGLLEITGDLTSERYVELDELLLNQ